MNVLKMYWGEVILIVAHLINRLPSRMLDFKDPINPLTKFYPHFDCFIRIALKIFGGVAFVHIQANHRTILGTRALKLIFIGYSLTKKGI